MFFIAGALTSVGAVSPAAVAIIAPIALGFAVRHGINPLMMGLMVIHGAQGGGFSPISIYGGITNKVVAKAGLPLNEIATMMASLAVNLTVASLLFFLMGGMKLIRQGADPCSTAFEPPRVHRQDEAQVRGDTVGESLPEKRCKAGQVEDSPVSAAPSVLPDIGARPYRIVTVAGLLILVVLTLFFGRFFRMRRPYREKLMPYESGNEPTAAPRTRFSIKFYYVAILFVIVDVEAIYLYTWAVEFVRLGSLGLVEMLTFMTLLILAYAYAWKKGAFEWVK